MLPHRANISSHRALLDKRPLPLREMTFVGSPERAWWQDYSHVQLVRSRLPELAGSDQGVHRTRVALVGYTPPGGVDDDLHVHPRSACVSRIERSVGVVFGGGGFADGVGEREADARLPGRSDARSPIVRFVEHPQPAAVLCCRTRRDRSPSICQTPLRK